LIVGESILLLKKYIEHKLLVIIQARTSSKRFRNKVLKKIYGETLISHIVNRLKKSNLISNVIVATSKEKSDDKLVKHLNDEQDEDKFAQWSHVLLDQALLAERGTLKDPTGFVTRLNKLMLELSK